MLGDIIEVTLHDGAHRAKVVLIGDSGEHRGIEDKTATWAMNCGHVKSDDLMAEFIDGNPFAHNDPRYAPVANTITTRAIDVNLVEREGSQNSVKVVEHEYDYMGRRVKKISGSETTTSL